MLSTLLAKSILVGFDTRGFLFYGTDKLSKLEASGKMP